MDNTWKLSLTFHRRLSIYGKYLYKHLLVKFEHTRMVRTTQNAELFNKKVLKTISDKALTPFWNSFFVAEKWYEFWLIQKKKKKKKLSLNSIQMPTRGASFVFAQLTHVTINCALYTI